MNYVLVRSTSCEVNGDFGLVCYSQLLGDLDCTIRRMSATARELWRVVVREVCTNKPLLEFLWCDGNLRTLHGVWNSETT